uniref:Uncharacterized protein n=1 Tax=Quercus lobata TaxID=97700 RepID=A0A7N2LLQ5_QUELO
MIEKVATGVLSGVVKVSGFLTGSVANSRVGKKFFGLLPREIVLASLDGFIPGWNYVLTVLPKSICLIESIIHDIRLVGWLYITLR